MKVRYIGNHTDGVVIGALDYDHIVYVDGVIDVDDELGCGLCEQITNWVPEGKTSKAFFDEFCTWAVARRAEIELAERNTSDGVLVFGVPPSNEPKPANSDKKG